MAGSSSSALSILRSARPQITRVIPLSRSASSSPWTSKTHLKRSASIPPPMPAIYPQRVLLSDGSTFTSYTTAPTPSILRLTRDVTNNPLWAPGTEKRGLGEGVEEGRVGRFRRRFEGTAGAGLAGSDAGAAAGAGAKKADGGMSFAEADFEWMSEGAKEEKVSAKEMQGKPKAGKKR